MRVARALGAVLLVAACGDPEPREGSILAQGGPAAPLSAPRELVGNAPGSGLDAPVAMVGVLVPETEVVLVSAGFARLARLDVQVGDHVEQDEVVAEMDVRGDRSELAATTAAWKASKAELERLALELEQARANRSDVEKLEDFVTKAELREKLYAEKLTAARKRSAGATAQQQRSRMTEASTRIAEAQLRAPFSGSVARRFVHPGATLGTGEAVVQLISDARLVRFAVPEERAKRVRLGDPVVVAFDDEGLELTGEVTTIAPQVEAGTRLVLAEARVPAREATALRVGTVGRVRFRDDAR